MKDLHVSAEMGIQFSYVCRESLSLKTQADALPVSHLRTFCVGAVVTFGVNLAIGVPLLSAVFGLLGPVVLYAVLQIGGPNKRWPQLR